MHPGMALGSLSSSLSLPRSRFIGTYHLVLLKEQMSEAHSGSSSWMTALLYFNKKFAY